ncbi:enoyl-CoA hydratase/isomerase family protein [Bordetella sp. BOR01]|uniref:enoyl-CoA hydratase/isomerase family protein n=1 Tax=Bordetella sp. BOR01 TaxID=2854779 RepID=UPI001C48383F|nr:enoyl-CoA hydratase/isomerase family protein [Bordetella sp. BOR01]MBV7482290.1 enoyl-CoA hydratase/isomerase family protein [Bordetella sp. BOR01]
MTRDKLRVERHPGWALIRIDRPHKRNALDRALRAGLMAALRGLEGEARAIVLTGSGSAFCAGLDLTERAADRAAGQDTGGAEWVELNAAIRAHPAAFIAAVNGMALGGGVTLMNSCDLALASDNATFACPELGFATYASASGPTTQLSGIARKRAAWLLLTTERLDATTVERWGLLNEVVAPPALLPRAAALAERLAGYDPVALTAVKQALDHIPAVIRGWREAMEYGQRVNAGIRHHNNHTPSQETTP